MAHGSLRTQNRLDAIDDLKMKIFYAMLQFDIYMSNWYGNVLAYEIKYTYQERKYNCRWLEQHIHRSGVQTL